MSLLSSFHHFEAHMIISAQYKFTNHHGEENARLSRDQSILASSSIDTHWALSLSSRLLFGIPKTYTERLETLFVDELVYVDHWHHFMAECLQQWQESVSWSFMLLMFVPFSSNFLAQLIVSLTEQMHYFYFQLQFLPFGPYYHYLCAPAVSWSGQSSFKTTANMSDQRHRLL